MNERLLTDDPLAEIEALRRHSPASALSRLNDAPAELFVRPEVRLTQAELVHELRGAAVARPLLARLVAEFPDYASAFYRLARVHDDLQNRAAALACRLSVHRLDAILDDALEPCDETAIEKDLTQTALEALAVAPSWVRGRLSRVPLEWCGRPTLQKVEQGFDPRALGEVCEVRAEVDSSSTRTSLLTLVLYRTNLLASADDENELRQNLRVAIRELLDRMA
jgi:hypothetical protein